MYRFAIRALAVLAVAAGLAAVPVRAQQIDTMTITVPFAFNVGKRTMPAGTYRVLRPSSSASTYLLRGVDVRDHVAVISPASREASQVGRARLVFDASGDAYALAQIWMPGSVSGAELPSRRGEKHLAGAGEGSRTLAVVARP